MSSRIIINDISSLIEVLQEIEAKYKTQSIPVAINLYHDRVLALKSICLDNDDTSLGVQVFFEADLEDRAEMSSSIEYYEQVDTNNCDYAIYCTEDGTLDIFNTYNQAQNYLTDNLHQSYNDETGLYRYMIVPMKMASENKNAEIVLYNATDGMFAFATEFLVEDMYNSDLLDADAINPIRYIHDIDRQ